MKALVLPLRRKVIIALLALGLGIAIPFATVSRTGALTQDEQAIEQVVTRAETDELTLPDLHAPPSDDAHIQAALASATLELDSLYAPSSSRLATRIDQVRHVLNGDRSGGLIEIASGIRNVSFATIAITGAIATAHVTFTAYSTFTVRQPNGQVAQSSPSNDMIADVSLVKTGQGWRISDEVARFAPGSAP